MSITSNILMIRPVQFAFNAETAVNNSFQTPTIGETVQEKALQEFDAFVEKLVQNGVDVLVVQDTEEPHTPDSIFPNNWISFHENGTVCLYPMFAINRRQERKQYVKDTITQHFHANRIFDFTSYEQQNLFLEGTGSMVLDRENKMAYACLSPRTNKDVLKDFCAQMNYTPITFIANDVDGKPIYHTNVMMCVADKYVVICMDSISAEHEKAYVKTAIESSGKQIVDISFDQMNHFAGNMLQIKNKQGEPLLVMSSQAYQHLSTEQINTLESFNKIVHSDITTIETNGGGSARCMMAEIFLPSKAK